MSKVHGSERRNTVNVRIPETLFEKMKNDGFTENFGYYLEEIYNQTSRKYESGFIENGFIQSSRDTVLDELHKKLLEEVCIVDDEQVITVFDMDVVFGEMKVELHQKAGEQG